MVDSHATESSNEEQVVAWRGKLVFSLQTFAFDNVFQ